MEFVSVNTDIYSMVPTAGFILVFPCAYLPQEKQFTIILELLGDNKFNTLTERERRSLAMLKDDKKKTSM